MCANVFADLYGALAYQPALILLLTGLFSGTWFIYQIWAKPEEEEERPGILKVIDLLGMLFGVLIVVPTGIMMFFIPTPGVYAGGLIEIRIFTKILIIILGMGLFLKPLKDVPWAGLLAAIAGIVVLVFLTIFMDKTFIGSVLGVALGNIMPWILLIIFGIIFIFVYMLTKIAGDMMGLIGKLFASKAGSLIMMGIAIIQAILISIPLQTGGALVIGLISIIPW